MKSALARTFCTTCAALVAWSCVSLSFTKRAREEFAKSVSCPPTQVEVRERPDVAAHRVAEHSTDGPLSIGEPASPAPDVAADPVRLRYWKQQQAERYRRLDDYYTVYEASGCGKRQLLCCGNDGGFTFCGQSCPDPL